MKITNIGGATAIVEHNGKRILFDPWMDDGIFHGAWYHYPPLKIGIKDLGRFDYVYISHIHEDHCSAGTIKYLNPDAEIILMDKTPNYVEKFLKTNGFLFKKIHLIRPRTPTKLSSDLWIDIVEADPANEIAFLIDSSLILKWDGFVIYNANDCLPYDDGIQYIKTTYNKVDLALLPYSGGSGYPSCYTNLTHDEKIKEKNRICEQRILSFVESAKALQPDYVMPFADQYVVSGSRAHLNQYISHLPSRNRPVEALYQAGFNGKGLLLNSGQTFDLSSHSITPNTPIIINSEEDREHYIRASLSDKIYDHEKIALNPIIPLERLVAYSRARLWKMQQRDQYFPDFSFYLDIVDRRRRLQIHLNEESAVEIGWNEKPIEPYLRLSGSNTLMIMLLIGHISWNIADAALFLDYERIPNVYDSKIHAYLNYLRI